MLYHFYKLDVDDEDCHCQDGLLLVEVHQRIQHCRSAQIYFTWITDCSDSIEINWFCFEILQFKMLTAPLEIQLEEHITFSFAWLKLDPLTILILLLEMLQYTYEKLLIIIIDIISLNNFLHIHLSTKK